MRNYAGSICRHPELRVAGSAPSPRETPCNRHSWPITMRGSPSRRQIKRTCIGRCAPVTISRTRLPGRNSAASPGRQHCNTTNDLHRGAGEPAKAAIGKYVIVFDFLDDRLSIRYNGVELAYRTFDKFVRSTDNKHLGMVLAMILDDQLHRGAEQRSGPRRRDQREARLCKVG
jgi:hypothetical protein